MSTHQKLMHEAGKKHRPGMKYGDFLLQLDVLERRATILGDLNNQVENGGFIQWRDNGYDDTTQLVYDAIDAIETDTAKKVRQLVSAALSIDMSNQYDEDSYNDIDAKMSGLDFTYYAVNEDFMKDCEAYFAKESVK